MRTFREGRRPSRTRRSWRSPNPVALVDWAQAAKTVLAGVLAWVIATEVLGLEQAFLAPWAAVLVVHATVFRTVSRGGQQVVATFLGVLIGWSAATLFGTGALGMGLMLAVSFVIGRHRWLKEEATTIATTGIVVLATYGADESHLLGSRLLDTTVGVVVGLAVNLLVWPPLRDRAAWAHAHQLPHELAGVLSEMASGLGPDLASSDVEGWVRRCRELDIDIDEAWSLVRQAQESSRLNPRRSRPDDLEELVGSLHLLEQSVAEALSLARTRGHQRRPRERLGRLVPRRVAAAPHDHRDGAGRRRPGAAGGRPGRAGPDECRALDRRGSPRRSGRSTAACWSTCATSWTPRSS